jgi:hypothetical protein
MPIRQQRMAPAAAVRRQTICKAIAEQSPPAAAMSPPIQPVPVGATGDMGLPEPPRAPQPAAVTAPESRGTHAELDWALPVLGLGAGASADEMDAAYATLVRRYNPATVIELGPEFAVLAVQRTCGQETPPTRAQGRSPPCASPIALGRRSSPGRASLTCAIRPPPFAESCRAGVSSPRRRCRRTT